MQTGLFDIIDSEGGEFPKIEIHFSFEPYLRYLKNRWRNENSIKKDFFEKIGKEIEGALKEHGPVNERNLFKFTNELALIHASLDAPLSEENKSFWALGFPMGQKICFGTDRFYELLQHNECRTHLTIAPVRPYGDGFFPEKKRMLYSFILERLYGFGPSRDMELIHSFVDRSTGLQKYYKIHIDHSFVDVEVIGERPDFDRLKVRDEFSRTLDLGVIESLLPLDGLRLKGFSILTVHDVTTEQAYENIKNIIIKGDEVPDSYNQVVMSLRTLAGNSDIEFSLLPFLKLNGKVLVDYENHSTSALARLMRNNKFSPEHIQALLVQFIGRPEIILFNREEWQEKRDTEAFLYGLNDFGIEDYALFPIFHNTEIVGVMEVFAEKKGILDDGVLSRVFTANTLLAQLLKDEIVEFTTKLNEVIKDRFTSLQPAVQWKFNDRAWEYLQALQGGDKPSIGDVKFEGVYPLYGAIDIRNSTVERNVAVFQDMTIQLKLLKNTLVRLKELMPLAILDEMIFNCERWMGRIDAGSISMDHFQLNEFLGRNVPGVLAYFRENSPGSHLIIAEYEDAVHPDTGVVHINRKALERSVGLVNSEINGYLEQSQVELQNSYPCYFEKFRSDGVEYDIYIGQSIVPYKRFSEVYLKNVRLWQLTSMAEMAKIAHRLLDRMEKQLYTTQLIFVHANPIDICFRTDERRFDVEGAYNIRYQVIKKRIDKVLIKGTEERLTQPGKIALVYFPGMDIGEYRGYILYLQKNKVLLDDLEEIDLEELQGVKGLQALRVGIDLTD